MDQLLATTHAPRRRTVSAETADRMAAKAMVAPTGRLLLTWNQRSIHLLMLGECPPARRVAFAGEAEVLLDAVRTERMRLRQALTDLPDGVRHQSVVEDTERGLGDVEARLRRAKDLLSAPTN